CSWRPARRSRHAAGTTPLPRHPTRRRPSRPRSPPPPRRPRPRSTPRTRHRPRGRGPPPRAPPSIPTRGSRSSSVWIGPGPSTATDCSSSPPVPGATPPSPAPSSAPGRRSSLCRPRPTPPACTTSSSATGTGPGWCDRTSRAGTSSRGAPPSGMKERWPLPAIPAAPSADGRPPHARPEGIPGAITSNRTESATGRTSTMDVAIAGGHGKIALHLAEQLSGQGHRVRALIRNPDHADDVSATGATPVLLDLERAGVEEVAEAVAGADAVVFAAGAGPGSGAPRKYTVDRDGSILLADAAERAGVRRFLQISAMGADEPPATGDEVWVAYLD